MNNARLRDEDLLKVYKTFDMFTKKELVNVKLPGMIRVIYGCPYPILASVVASPVSFLGPLLYNSLV